MIRRIVILVALFQAGAAWAQSTRAWSSWHNSLDPRGAKADVVLATEGKAACSILLRADASGSERKAATDFHDWVKAISGADLPVGENAAGTHWVKIERRTGLGTEGYALAVDGGNLTIAGEGRGIVDGVYAVLEEDMGCRFYTNDSIRLPKSPTLVAHIVPRTYTPQLKLRDPFFKVSFDPVWSLRNRTNAPDAAVPEEYGGHIDYGGLFVHTAHSLVPPEKYFKDHPEYFEMNAAGKRVPVQLCTSNPEVRRIATEAVLNTLREHPETEIVSVSRLDVMEVCHCPACTKLRAEEGSEMADQLLMVNEIAAAVEKQFPGVMVDTLAYLETVPLPKTIRPRKNVVIRLCNDAVGAWNRPFTPAAELPVADIARQWSAVCDRLSIWDYHVNFSHYLAPMPNLDVIAKNIRFWTDNHAWGVMTQAGYQGAAERDEMKSWVIAKLLWDPSRDWEELAQDFIWGHYGKAAPAICDYEELLADMRKDPETQHPRGGIRYPMDSHFLSKDFVNKADAIFARAEALAAGDEALSHRVERAELPVMYVKLSRGPAFAPDFAAVLDKFERVGKREGVTHLAEVWPGDFDKRVAEWRKQVPTTGPVAR